jgi:hypothetical protein
MKHNPGGNARLNGEVVSTRISVPGAVRALSDCAATYDLACHV